MSPKFVNIEKQDEVLRPQTPRHSRAHRSDGSMATTLTSRETFRPCRRERPRRRRAQSTNGVVVARRNAFDDYAPSFQTNGTNTNARVASRIESFIGREPTPAQVMAFKSGLALGVPMALVLIARDVRKQNIEERRRATSLTGKERTASALDGRRGGRLRPMVGGDGGNGGGRYDDVRRAEVRRTRNVMDIPIASNKAAASGEKRAAPAKPKPKPIPKPTVAKKGPPMRVTLASQCELPEGAVLCVVGEDAAIKNPLELKRVGKDRWQVVVELREGDLEYSYVAKKGGKMFKERGGARQRTLRASDNPLIIEERSPNFK